MTIPANLFTGAKHSAFSTNHLTDTDKTEHNYMTTTKNHTENPTKHALKLLIHVKTKACLRAFYAIRPQDTDQAYIQRPETCTGRYIMISNKE